MYPESMVKRAGTWIRVSTGKQDERNQQPRIDDYCAARGYKVVEGCRYEVHARSAYKGAQQADLDKMLADMRDGKFKVLVVWHSDRLERRPGKALLDLLQEVAAAGGRVESVEEPSLGKVDFGGQVVTFIGGLMNHEKSLHISQQVHLARENGATGFWGRLPYGYKSEGSKHARQLVPDPELKPVVEKIFQMIADGDGTPTVAAWLTEETGRKWYRQTVGAIVRNGVYGTGLAAGGGGPRTHKCEPLVDYGLWKQANARLDNRPHRGPNAEVPAMLRGAVYCAECGAKMYRNPTRDRWFYYKCGGCQLSAPLEPADRAVDTFVSSLTSLEVTERKWVPGNDHEGEIAAIWQQLRDLPARGLDEDDEDAERARLRAERKRLQALPSEPDEWLDIPTGKTHAEMWEQTPPADRGKWLAKYGLKVVLSKTWAEVWLTGCDGVETGLVSRRFPLRPTEAVDPVALTS
jgi:DNA invertase Pin-like site-specific DNA recombinase